MSVAMTIGILAVITVVLVWIIENIDVHRTNSRIQVQLQIQQQHESCRESEHRRKIELFQERSEQRRKDTLVALERNTIQKIHNAIDYFMGKDSSKAMELLGKTEGIRLASLHRSLPFFKSMDAAQIAASKSSGLELAQCFSDNAIKPAILAMQLENVQENLRKAENDKMRLEGTLQAKDDTIMGITSAVANSQGKDTIVTVPVVATVK